MAKKQSSSQVSCGEVVAISATFANYTSQYNHQLAFDAGTAIILLNLEGIGRSSKS